MSLFNILYGIGMKFKNSTVHLTYGRHIVLKWTERIISEKTSDSPLNILDVGCGKGVELSCLKDKYASKVNLFAVENYEPYRIECADKGIRPYDINIERDPFPFQDEFFDVIIINQVIEHCKELFFIFSEVSRTLKKGGCLIVGVPNMAAWHDRLALLLGEQPTSAKVLGPHIRGFTKPGFKHFIQTDGYFKLKETKGSGFYPFPLFAAKLLAKLFPTLATAIFFRMERTEKEGLFIEVLKSRHFETNFYPGT